MVHQLNLTQFLSLATAGTARSALAKLNLSSGPSDRQTLVDLVGASWREVLVKMEGKTKPEVVEAAAEYGITLRRSDTNVAIIAKFVEVFERDWPTLVENQASEDNDPEVKSTPSPRESRDEVAPHGDPQASSAGAVLDETQGGRNRGTSRGRASWGLISRGWTSQGLTSRGRTSQGRAS